MRLRSILVTVVAAVIIASAGCAGWLWSTLVRPRTVAVVELVIAPGTTGRDALRQLHDTALLPSPFAGRLYLRVAAGGRTIHYGSYRFEAGSRPIDVLEQILAGAIEMVTVTVVEGSDLAAVAAQMAAAGIGEEDAWLDTADRIEWITDLMPRATSLEGFFFPDTYQFAHGIDVETAARHLVNRFREVWSEESSRHPTLWGEPYEALILASLVEAETGSEAERGRIAGVYLNRLRRGMLLQCDPTVIYALKRRGEWSGRLLRIHWDIDDPYNTYRYPGLPPGPINSPGRAAIAAAIAPEAHTLLYFVASPDGGHTFSHTLAEHNLAVARWQRSRR